ncbi:MAG: hypothetical protein WCA23_01515 [Stellaceae bacterium]
MLLTILIGDDGRHVELHAVQVELAAWPGISRFTVAPSGSCTRPAPSIATV